MDRAALAVLPGVMPRSFRLDGVEEAFDAVGCEGVVGLVSDELDVLVREPDLAVGIGGASSAAARLMPAATARGTIAVLW